MSFTLKVLDDALEAYENISKKAKADFAKATQQAQIELEAAQRKSEAEAGQQEKQTP